MENPIFISPATLSRKAKIEAFACCLIGGCFVYSAAEKGFFILAGLSAVLVLAALLAAFACTPYRYILTESGLIIRRRIGNMAIPLRDIRQVLPMTSHDRKSLKKRWKIVDGSFGKFGYYTSPKYQRIMVCVRHDDHWILIVTDRKKYVIAPDDLQLVNRIVQQIGPVSLP